MQKIYEVVNDNFAVSLPGQPVHHVTRGVRFTVDLEDAFHRFDHLAQIGYLKLVEVVEDPPPAEPEPEPVDPSEPAVQSSAHEEEEQ